ncbi:hypothetical protein FQN50_004133 [Emmonsiellopsis sp. PD_5]|nr:hypothetical protein FQN50_004133 [Emmonsiellopsis sp. PD_5]
MVFPSLEQPRDTYHLLDRFSFPTEDGFHDSIAVSSKSGDYIVAAYSLIVDAIFLQVWVALILLAIVLTNRFGRGEKNSFLAEVYYARESIFEVFMVSAYRVFTDPRVRPIWIGLMWLVVALLGTALQKAMSVIITPSAHIGNGAPVSFDRIYIPLPPDDPTLQIVAFELEAPGYFRALGTSQVANESTTANILVNQTTLPGNGPNDSPRLRIDFGYNISSLEFGLQNYQELKLFMEGSCYTEYGWIDGTSSEDGIFTDVYNLWGDESKSFSVNSNDAQEPRLYVERRSMDPEPSGNNSFVFIPSTLGRKSFTNSTDPWYKTSKALDERGRATILNGRPVLVCWQKDWWSYKDNNSTIADVDKLPGLETFAKGLGGVFRNLLINPKVADTATHLGSLALKSATTSLGITIDGKGSSMPSDLQRILLVSYISTQNLLLDTTLYPNDTSGVPNFIDKENRDVADFIVYGSEISTLSIRFLIVIPALAIGMLVVVLLLEYWGRESIREFQYQLSKNFVAHYDATHSAAENGEALPQKADDNNVSSPVVAESKPGATTTTAPAAPDGPDPDPVR